MSHTSLIKALSMVGAAAAVSLTLANAASAFTVKTTRTVSDGFGDRVTKSRTVSDNGFQRCVTFRRTATDAFGDRNSRSFRNCRPDF
jgi:hypothetical protein